MKYRLALCLALLMACASLPGAAFAVDPDEMLNDPALEARARAISQQLRCLVCQNQSIDDSQADLARDLRILVRERLKAGDSDKQVIDFVVARYGDFVLLKPPVNEQTLGLWFGPLALVALGLGGIAVYFARRRRSAPRELSATERRRLEELLKSDAP